MIRSLLALALLASLAVTSAGKQTTTEIIAVISPAPDEQAWLSIPWETNLTAARRKAAEMNRPIFLWEMDGHPLGCT
jgi:hypothetical protein